MELCVTNLLFKESQQTYKLSRKKSEIKQEWERFY